MNSVMVAIFVRDRFYHVKMCMDWFLKSPAVSDLDVQHVVFDDHSTDEKLFRYEQLMAGSDIIDSRVCKCVSDPSRRIGCLRRLAVESFLYYNRCDFLLLLDSDIILTKATLAEAIGDYNTLCDLGYHVGGATLYTLGHLKEKLVVGNKTFHTADLTGDAHMLFRRDHLKKVGNCFSAKPNGFADHQIQAIYDAKMIYYTRTDPPYQVQHIGFGEGASSIYGKKGFTPYWTARPYWTHFEPKRVIEVEGLDVLHYADLANRFGGLEAPKRYLQERGIPWSE